MTRRLSSLTDITGRSHTDNSHAVVVNYICPINVLDNICFKSLNSCSKKLAFLFLRKCRLKRLDIEKKKRKDFCKVKLPARNQACLCKVNILSGRD